MPEFVLVDRDFAPPRDDSRTREYERMYTRAAPGQASRGRSGEGRRGASAVIVLAALLAASALAALFIVVVLPLTEIRGLVVTGASTIDAAELEAWSGLPERAYWFSVDIEPVRISLAAHPRVASVTVERRFPNAVAVAVVERVPIAVVYARGPSGRTEAHCVDAAGVVFAPASEYPAAESMPVLSGLEIRGLRYGIRLDEPFTGLLASLAELLGSNPALVSAISELRIVSKEGAPAELLVYPARYRVPVRMRPVLNAGLLKSMMLVLDVVEGEGLSSSIREIDLRTDTFVYRTKEAVSG
jgi:cell division protein FtsQ